MHNISFLGVVAKIRSHTTAPGISEQISDPSADVCLECLSLLAWQFVKASSWQISTIMMYTVVRYCQVMTGQATYTRLGAMFLY